MFISDSFLLLHDECEDEFYVKPASQFFVNTEFFEFTQKAGAKFCVFDSKKGKIDFVIVAINDEKFLFKELMRLKSLTLRVNTAIPLPCPSSQYDISDIEETLSYHHDKPCSVPPNTAILKAKPCKSSNLRSSPYKRPISDEFSSKGEHSRAKSCQQNSGCSEEFSQCKPHSNEVFERYMVNAISALNQKIAGLQSNVDMLLNKSEKDCPKKASHSNAYLSVRAIASKILAEKRLNKEVSLQLLYDHIIKILFFCTKVAKDDC